jgi:hypothetical protein
MIFQNVGIGWRHHENDVTCQDYNGACAQSLPNEFKSEVNSTQLNKFGNAGLKSEIYYRKQN